MSKVTKRKHVMNEKMWDDTELPNKEHKIVKVTKSRGNNLHEVLTPTGELYLVSMPTKFRHNIWVRRGSYILVESIQEGKKVKAEIVKILNKDSIKFYKESNLWPKEFDEPKSETTVNNEEDLFVNPNRQIISNYDGESSESSESSESCESSDNSGDTSDTGDD